MANYTPKTNSFAIAVTAVASSAVSNPITSNAARMAVVGTQPVFITLDGSAPAIPADGANGSGMMLLPNSVEVIALPTGGSIRAIAGNTGSSLYITFGVGE